MNRLGSLMYKGLTKRESRMGFPFFNLKSLLNLSFVNYKLIMFLILFGFYQKKYLNCLYNLIKSLL